MMRSMFSLGAKPREPLLFKRPKHGNVAHCERDWCARENAADLVLRISEYWRARGRTVELKVIDIGFYQNARGTVTVIRSNMVNGLPGEKP